MQTTYNKKEKHMKVSKKKKNDKTYKFMIKYIDKFDLLVKRAQKEKEELNLDFSIHALTSAIMRQIVMNNVMYYGTTDKIRETMQSLLDDEVNHRYIQAKQERERAKLN
jgi:cellulose biosynthesis protein BcsQ